MRRRYVLTLLALTGCTRGMVTPATAPGDDACTIMPTAANTLDTIHIALPVPVDPGRLGRPQNPAEATLAAALYETLVETDCRNAPLPAFATSWSHDSSRTRWRFELRPDATFDDGTTLTARAVAAAWSDRSDLSRTDARARIESVEVTGFSTLGVVLDAPADATLFADPRLGIRPPTPESPWPVGTGPYRVDSAELAGGGVYSSLRLSLDDSRRPVRQDGLPLALHFDVPPSGDMRTALDLGADLVVTRDPAVLAYARELTDYTSTALPWDRTYLLIAPRAVVAMPLPDGVREAFARDAIRGDARASPPLQSPILQADGNATQDRRMRRNQPPPRAAARIVYQRGDDVARGLAERLVALMAAPDRHGWLAARLPEAVAWTAHALEPAAFAAALYRGNESGYVAGGASRYLRGARPAGIPLPWLPDSAVAREAIITPLVETRPRVIHRTGVGPVRIDAAGTLRFTTPSGTARR